MGIFQSGPATMFSAVPLDDDADDDDDDDDEDDEGGSDNGW